MSFLNQFLVIKKAMAIIRLLSLDDLSEDIISISSPSEFLSEFLSGIPRYMPVPTTTEQRSTKLKSQNIQLTNR